MKGYMKLFVCLFFLSSGALVIAEPTSSPVKISQIRTYINGDIFLHLESNLDICPMSVYKIQAGSQGANQMHSLALAALLADKAVRIEIPAPNVCPWGQSIQSIYIVK